jgi:hypothetical protein
MENLLRWKIALVSRTQTQLLQNYRNMFYHRNLKQEFKEKLSAQSILLSVHSVWKLNRITFIVEPQHVVQHPHQLQGVCGVHYRQIRKTHTRGQISLWLYKENNKLRLLKKCIYSTYSPLNSTHLWLRCSNFFNPSEKNFLVVLQIGKANVFNSTIGFPKSD